MAPRSKQILVIEPDPRFRAYVERTLAGSKYRITSVATADEGLTHLAAQTPDLVLLDLALPSGNGFELCRSLHQRWSVPIIVFTTSERGLNIADALDVGAHDFLSTPFSVEELRARVQRAVERPAPDRSSQARALRVGGLEINLETQTIARDGQMVPLSRTDWALLEFLVSHAGQVLPHRMILQRVWGDAFTNEIGYLRSYVKRLRDALEDDPKNPQLLQTEPRLGYRFVVSDQPAHLSHAVASPQTPTAPCTNVPTPLTSFVGREAEVAGAITLLQRPDVRLLTLTGPGGVGKTRLALHVGAQVVRNFRSGVCFVDLSHIRAPDMVVSEIAQVLGVKDHDDEGLLERVKQALHAQDRLLILDNFEHVLAGAPAVSELLRALPGVKIVATSRSPLHISGEHELPVPPLALPDQTAPWRSTSLHSCRSLRCSSSALRG